MSVYHNSKGKASEKTIERKQWKKRGELAWSGKKGTYIRKKHGELK